MGKQVYTKITMIVIAEALAMTLTNFISKHFIPIKHSSLSYIVCGAILAFFVVLLYDRIKEKRRYRIMKEVKSLADAALMRYNVQDKNHHN